MLRREPVKTIRDYLKKDYKTKTKCYICGSKDNLELHHLYGVSELFNRWCEKNSIKNITSTEQVEELRIIFAEDLAEELSNIYLYTLCKTHHTKLHNIYGQRYSNSKVTKIKKWIDLQRENNGNI